MPQEKRELEEMVQTCCTEANIALSSAQMFINRAVRQINLAKGTAEMTYYNYKMDILRKDAEIERLKEELAKWKSQT